MSDTAKEYNFLRRYNGLREGLDGFEGSSGMNIRFTWRNECGELYLEARVGVWACCYRMNAFQLRNLPRGFDVKKLMVSEVFRMITEHAQEVHVPDPPGELCRYCGNVDVPAYDPVCPACAKTYEATS